MVLRRLGINDDFIPHHEWYQGKASVQHEW
jgi:hypothetical protein